MPGAGVRPYRSVLAAGLAGVAVAAAGCGGEDPPATDEQQVTGTLRTFLGGAADGDGDAACRMLTPAARRELTRLVARRAGTTGLAPATCAEAAGLVRAVAPPVLLTALRGARIERVLVRGSTASARVTDAGVGGFAAQRVLLTRTDEGWRIARAPGLLGR